MRRLYLLIMVLALAGCGVSKKQRAAMDSWLGESKAHLVQVWGAPTSVFHDGNREVLIYEKSGSYLTATPGYVYNQYGSANYVATQRASYTVRYQFFVDSSGRIYHWMIQPQY